MTDFTSALKPDVFRSFAVYICPGIVASAPWLYGVVWPDGLWRLLYGSGTVVSAGVLTFIGLTTGLMLEEIGGMIELHLDEKLGRKSETADVSQTFWSYLGTPSSHSTVADKFLSATVTRYKFELSMSPGLACAGVAFVKMGLVDKFDYSILFIAGICFCLSYYLYREACDSASLLHRLRKEILIVKTP